MNSTVFQSIYDNQERTCIQNVSRYLHLQQRQLVRNASGTMRMKEQKKTVLNTFLSDIRLNILT